MHVETLLYQLLFSHMRYFTIPVKVTCMRNANISHHLVLQMKLANYLHSFFPVCWEIVLFYFLRNSGEKVWKRFYFQHFMLFEEGKGLDFIAWSLISQWRIWYQWNASFSLHKLFVKNSNMKTRRPSQTTIKGLKSYSTRKFLIQNMSVLMERLATNKSSVSVELL